MLFRSNGKYEYKKDGIDQIISEHGDMFLALREVRWSANKDYKLDLRHYRSDELGDKTLKGCSFNDDEADELTKILLSEGFGDDYEIAGALASYRPNICKALFESGVLPDIESQNSDDDTRVKLFSKRCVEKDKQQEEDSDEYYDPRELLS